MTSVLSYSKKRSRRIQTAFAFVAVTACAARPTPPPPETPAPVLPAPTAAPVAEAPAPAPAPETTPSPAPNDPNDPLSPLPPASEAERTPGVQTGALVVRGQLHPTRVEAGMRTTYPAIRDCHKKALEAGTVEAKPVRVQLNFEITGPGEMTKLTDDTANLNPLFSSCVLRAVMTVKFQPPKRGVVSVTYPLELTKP